MDRLRAPWAREAVTEYMERLAHDCQVGRRDVKASRGDDPRGVDKEGERLLATAARGARDRLAALASGGEMMTSEGWATMLTGWVDDGVDRAVFLVGGARGLSRAVVETADRTLSLGPQTLPHELAQVVLAEQLYRAFTILRGKSYHK